MSSIFRFISAAGALLVLLGAAGTRAEANAIYTVDRLVASPFFATVTGELVTDGTLGPLTSANFIDWSLTIEGFGTDTLLGDLSGVNSLFVAAGDTLTATPDGLFFDFDGVGLLWVTNSGLPKVGSYWCLESAIGICNISDGETIGSKTFVEGFRGWMGVQKVATVKTTAVPEPASILLLAGGTLGFLARARKRHS
jgi:hypothetical protein